jgi:pimeloyl-ACP methyl ester carboxylesterase
VAGGTLRAEDTGGDRTSLVLIHADWTDSGIWDPLIPLLRDRYRVIRYDLRGFGRSSRPVQPFTRLGDLRGSPGTRPTTCCHCATPSGSRRPSAKSRTKANPAYSARNAPGR